MPKIIFEVAKAADVYANCVTPVDSTFTDTIVKGVTYNNVTPRHLVFNNRCGTAFIVRIRVYNKCEQCNYCSKHCYKCPFDL